MTNDKECGFDGGDCCLPYIRSSHLQSLNISDVYWADQLTLFQPGGHIMPSPPPDPNTSQGIKSLFQMISWLESMEQFKRSDTGIANDLVY